MKTARQRRPGTPPPARADGKAGAGVANRLPGILYGLACLLLGLSLCARPFMDEIPFRLSAVKAVQTAKSGNAELHSSGLHPGELSRVVMAVVLVGFSTLATAVLVFLLSLRLRRREIQALHKIGAARGRVFALLAGEVGIVLVLSVSLAAILTLWTGRYGAAAIRLFLT